MLMDQKQLLASYLENISSSRGQSGLKTGIFELDQMIGGLENFVILGGKSGSGKTSLATQMALGIVQNEQIPVIFFSFEMKSEDILTLMIQNLSEKTLKREEIINTSHDEKLSNPNMAKSIQKLNSLMDLIYIFDGQNGVPSLAEIEDKIREIQDKHQTKQVFVVIDSFNDLVADSEHMVAAKAEEDVVQKLFQIQLKTGSTVLAIAQRINNSLRGGSSEDGLKGSVALYHKPTTVLELISYKEMLLSLEANSYSAKREKLEIENLIKNSNISTPLMLYVSKHRNNTNSRLYLKFYGSYRYFEAGIEPAFENRNKFRIYSYLEQ